MRTLGVDLSAGPEKTAMCAIEWNPNPTIEFLCVGAEDGQILDEITASSWVAADAAFGWPEAFVKVVGEYARSGDWPGADVDLELRYTERRVTELTGSEGLVKIKPFSVSSDRIAKSAWRFAGILSDLRLLGWEFDRTGTVEQPQAPMVVECYPATALSMWRIDSKGYKSRRSPAEARKKRRSIWKVLCNSVFGSEFIQSDFGAKAAKSDDALDAVIAALVARAASLDQTCAPDPGQLSLAKEEGWIHVPLPDSLDGMV